MDPLDHQSTPRSVPPQVPAEIRQVLHDEELLSSIEQASQDFQNGQGITLGSGERPRPGLI